jgi:hypothetical protein
VPVWEWWRICRKRSHTVGKEPLQIIRQLGVSYIAGCAATLRGRLRSRWGLDDQVTFFQSLHAAYVDERWSLVAKPDLATGMHVFARLQRVGPPTTSSLPYVF